MAPSKDKLNSTQKSKSNLATKHFEDALRDSKNSKQMKDSIKEPSRKTLADVYSQVISEKILKEYSQELGNLRFENDLCLSIFTYSNQVNAKCIVALVQELNKINDEIIDMCLVNISDALYMYTMFCLLLRKLPSLHQAFNSVIELITVITKVLLEEPREEQYHMDLIKSLSVVIIPKLAEIIIDDPSKCKAVCELLMLFYSQDPKDKISAINQIKNLVESQPHLMYQTLVYLMEEQKEYDEQIFDVFLYYCITGIQHASSYVQCFSLHMLNNIAQHSFEEIFNLIPKFEMLRKVAYWEVKVQLVSLCVTLLLKAEPMKELLKSEENTKAKPNDKKVNDSAITKEKLENVLNIIEETLSTKESFSVLKIGMIYIIPLLNIYKRLYNKFAELMVVIPEQLRGQLLEEVNNKIELQKYTYGKYALAYPNRADPSKIDKLYLLKTMCEQVMLLLD